MGHIHILGICGTFMGSLAQLAAEMGYRVTGCDANVYPPMSTQLSKAGIDIVEGYDASQLSLKPDCFVIGNAMGRGNPLVEAILDANIPMISGPQWLYENILKDKWVLGVSGTHGKTTTSSLLAWILEYAGMSPGFLIGGVPENFGVSARLGETDFFVVEADEYDTAFFDKRSKFVHYHPRTLVINNLEFDHADIFNDLTAIQTQFHHLVRTIPQNGLIISPDGIEAIDEVIKQGCWTPIQTYSEGQSAWRYELTKTDGSEFCVFFEGVEQGTVEWSFIGLHNVQNALSAIIAARHVGVVPELSIEALSVFKGVKRRLERIAHHQGVSLYDDFAHHPTAIKTTLKGLRAAIGREKIIAVIEPRSNTMRLGVHENTLIEACAEADHVLWYSPKNMDWDIKSMLVDHKTHTCYETIPSLTEAVMGVIEPSSHVVIMSNGGFGGLHKLLADHINPNIND